MVILIIIVLVLAVVFVRGASRYEEEQKRPHIDHSCRKCERANFTVAKQKGFADGMCFCEYYKEFIKERNHCSNFSLDAIQLLANTIIQENSEN